MRKSTKTKSKPSKAIDSKEMILAMAELEKENGMEEGSLLESINVTFDLLLIIGIIQTNFGII